MLPQLTSLASAIDSYHAIASDPNTISSLEIRENILTTLESIWKILGKGGVTITKLMEGYERHTDHESGFLGICRGLEKSVLGNAKSDFTLGILTLFGISRPEQFLLRGVISPIVDPYISTKIRVGAILSETITKNQKQTKSHILSYPVKGLIERYIPTYSALQSKKSTIQNIVIQELIVPISEDLPYIQQQFGPIIDFFRKKNIKQREISDIEHRIANLRMLKPRGVTNTILTLQKRLKNKNEQYTAYCKRYRDIENNFSLDSLSYQIATHIDPSQPKKAPPHIPHTTILNPDIIQSRIQRSVSAALHKKHISLKNLRIYGGSLSRGMRGFENILKKYEGYIEKTEPIPADIYSSIEQSCNEWEEIYSVLLSQYPIKDIRILRETIISDLTVSS